MFGGVTHLNLDTKNRIAIPARYREILHSQCNSKITLTLDSAQCLLIYPDNIWSGVRDKIQNLPNSAHSLVKSYQRLVLGYAQNIELDSAGRVLIPTVLKDLIKLDKSVVLVGLGNRFEVWNEQAWHLETSKALEAPQDDLANLLNGFSL